MTRRLHGCHPMPMNAPTPTAGDIASATVDAGTVLVLVNLGTPEAPTPGAVRRYLREFLSDRRVVDLPRWLWWPLLNLVILPLRSMRVAHKYASIWLERGSPLAVYTRRLAQAVQRECPQWRVVHAMRYGAPAFAQVLAQLRDDGVRRARHPAAVPAVFDDYHRIRARRRRSRGFRDPRPRFRRSWKGAGSCSSNAPSRISSATTTSTPAGSARSPSRSARIARSTAMPRTCCSPSMACRSAWPTTAIPIRANAKPARGRSPARWGCATRPGHSPTSRASGARNGWSRPPPTRSSPWRRAAFAVSTWSRRDSPWTAWKRWKKSRRCSRQDFNARGGELRYIACLNDSATHARARDLGVARSQAPTRHAAPAPRTWHERDARACARYRLRPLAGLRRGPRRRTEGAGAAWLARQRRQLRAAVVAPARHRPGRARHARSWRQRAPAARRGLPAARLRAIRLRRRRCAGLGAFRAAGPFARRRDRQPHGVGAAPAHRDAC